TYYPKIIYKIIKFRK
ncbi:hypothetical protein D029_4697B, partial [Vibrio parahaemolyticus 970107]